MELWDLYDATERPLGKTMERGSAVPPGSYHLVVGVWVADGANRVLLTQRDAHKETYPGEWENTGGSVLAGEDSRHGAARELREETGIQAAPEALRLLAQRTETRCIVYQYFLHLANEAPALRLQPGETQNAQWVAWETLCRMAQSGELAAPVAERFHFVQRALHAALFGAGGV